MSCSSPAEQVVQEPPHSQYSPFILVSNLRAHLYVSLEKNAWLQKRIEELEEERNFLRCQLDRFIVSMRTPDGEVTKDTRPRVVCPFYLLGLLLLRSVTEWCGDAQRGVKVQPASSPAPPSPMTTRSGMTLKRLQGTGSRTRRNISIPGEEDTPSLK